MDALKKNNWGLKSKLDSEWSSRKSNNHVVDMEIDRNSVHSLLFDTVYNFEKSIAIYKIHEVPEFLRSNQFILNGYRSLLPFTQCVHSLFIWSNETINIWSHILGFFLFFYLMIWDNITGIAQAKGTIVDHVVLSLALICFQFCMLCSAGYHLFRCHSERSCQQWLALDLTGISVGLIGVFLPGIHYGFYCLSLWRDIYLVTIIFLFGAVLTIQSQRHSYSSQYFRRLLIVYCALVGYGIVPTVHWVYLNGGLSTQIVEVFVPRVVIMYILAVTSFVFYISKCPERCNPGRFDYIGCSHQWWHIIVVISFYYWHDSGLHFLKYRSQEAECH